MISDVEHAHCLENSTPPNFPCATCNTPVLPENHSEGALFDQLIPRLKTMPMAQTIFPADDQPDLTSELLPTNGQIEAKFEDSERSTSTTLILRSKSQDTVPLDDIAEESKRTEDGISSPKVPYRPGPSRPVPPAVPTIPQQDAAAAVAVPNPVRPPSFSATTFQSLHSSTSETHPANIMQQTQSQSPDLKISVSNTSKSTGTLQPEGKELHQSLHQTVQPITSNNIAGARGARNAVTPQNISPDAASSNVWGVLAERESFIASSRLVQEERENRRAYLLDRSRTGSLSSTSVTVRKLLKKGDRTMRGLRHNIAGYERQIVIGVLFVLSILLLVVLSSGDDEALQVSERDRVTPMIADVQRQNFGLPHVRVNPVFVQQRRSGHALSGGIEEDHRGNIGRPHDRDFDDEEDDEEDMEEREPLRFPA